MNPRIRRWIESVALRRAGISPAAPPAMECSHPHRRAIMERDFEALSKLGYNPHEPGNKRLLDSYLYTLNSGDFDHLSPMIDPGKASLDVGANVGQYTLKLAAESSRVIVIEPLKKMDFFSHSLPANCTFCNCAVGESQGEIDLKTPILNGEPNYALSTFLETKETKAGEHLSQKTPVERIDAIVERELGGMPVGFIKIDVEGWEYPALLGATETLRRDRPNLLVELWPSQMPAAGRQVEALGYRGFFYFNHRMVSLTAFRHSVHAAPENDFDPHNPSAFRPELHANNFFFIPV